MKIINIITQKSNVPRSLTDAVAKHKKDTTKDTKKPFKKPFNNTGDKKQPDGAKPKYKKSENKAPMTPAERRALKPNFSLVCHCTVKYIIVISNAMIC